MLKPPIFTPFIGNAEHGEHGEDATLTGASTAARWGGHGRWRLHQRTTPTATLRKRRLPSEQLIWLVLGMALQRDRPIAEVVSQLDLALPGAA